ncbi:MAG: hypothetical protein R8M38_00940 [Mariprofundaceae bacterium]
MIDEMTMSVHCPQCQALVTKDTKKFENMFFCSTCKRSFSLFIGEDLPGNDASENPDRIKENVFNIQKEWMHLHRQRHDPKILLWLSAVLLILAFIGIWKHQARWSEQPEFRYLIASLNLPISTHKSDWVTDNASAEWFIRNDGSPVLVVEGRITRNTAKESPPPHITISARSKDVGRENWKQTIVITQPPLTQLIRRAPYIPPPPDLLPLKPGTNRNFILVLESMPPQAATIRLSAAL